MTKENIILNFTAKESDLLGLKKQQLYYEVIPNLTSKEWIVFFHGLGGNCSIFKKQIPLFKEKYNLLLIDLPGHGESNDLSKKETSTLQATSHLVIDILNKENIETAHFVGVSLGTILMQYIAIHYPKRIKSMVLAGAVAKWRTWGEIIGRPTLMKGVRNLLPYKVPYVAFAFILMPKSNHKTSRKIFIREAKKLSKKAYHRWALVARDAYKLYNQLKGLNNKIPKLYISGNEDHMFLKGINAYVKNEEFSELHLIDKCGHVCNIEKPVEFNEVTLEFIHKHAAADQVLYKKIV